MTARDRLYNLVTTWDDAVGPEQAPYGRARSHQAMLDEVLFHAALRYGDHARGQQDGGFAARLEQWMCNVTHDAHRQVLFRMVPLIQFVSRLEMHSLYRDAYRRILLPWLVEAEGMAASELVAPDWGGRVIQTLCAYPMFCVTESFFRCGDFHQLNVLDGLPRMQQLAGHPREVVEDAIRESAGVRGVVVLEDFVGTGRQAGAALRGVVGALSAEQRVLFVALVGLEEGLAWLASEFGSSANVSIAGALTIPPEACVKRLPSPRETQQWVDMRAVVEATARRVVEPLDDNDDVADDPAKQDPFGYGGCGCLVVSHHNTPNNSVMLLHHKAPAWFPLFRRSHHARGT